MSELYTLTVNPSEVNFRPESVVVEILQNVNTIVATTKFSVPLFREFGINASFLDEPTPLIKSRLVAEVIEKVEHFEPRVIVEEIIINSNDDGQMVPTLKISIRRGVKM